MTGLFIYFLRFYLFIRDRERERDRQTDKQAEGEAGSIPCRELDGDSIPGLQDHTLG